MNKDIFNFKLKKNYDSNYKLIHQCINSENDSKTAVLNHNISYWQQIRQTFLYFVQNNSNVSAAKIFFSNIFLHY